MFVSPTHGQPQQDVFAEAELSSKSKVSPRQDIFWEAKSSSSVSSSPTNISDVANSTTADISCSPSPDLSQHLLDDPVAMQRAVDQRLASKRAPKRASKGGIEEKIKILASLPSESQAGDLDDWVLVPKAPRHSNLPGSWSTWMSATLGWRTKQLPPAPERPEAYVAATGVGFVGEPLPQDRLSEYEVRMRRALGQEASTIDFAAAMGARVGIRTRRLAREEYHREFGTQSGLRINPRLDEVSKVSELSRNERADMWWDVAQQVSERAATMALAEWARQPGGGTARDITHIITTTASGWREPGIACHLIKTLNLRSDVQKQELNMNGCFAALTCLRLARDIVRAGS